MSLTPGGALPEPPHEEVLSVPASQKRPSKLLTLCFAVFALEIGLVLVILPWQNSWSLNYLQGLSPAIEDIWDEGYFKGLLTGLGFVNIYIAILQTLRLFRRY